MYERCEKLRPTLFRLASDTTDDDEALGTVLISRRRQRTPQSVGPAWGSLPAMGLPLCCWHRNSTVASRCSSGCAWGWHWLSWFLQFSEKSGLEQEMSSRSASIEQGGGLPCELGVKGVEGRAAPTGDLQKNWTSERSEKQLRGACLGGLTPRVPSGAGLGSLSEVASVEWKACGRTEILDTSIEMAEAFYLMEDLKTRKRDSISVSSSPSDHNYQLTVSLDRVSLVLCSPSVLPLPTLPVLFLSKFQTFRSNLSVFRFPGHFLSLIISGWPFFFFFKVCYKSEPERKTMLGI